MIGMYWWTVLSSVDTMDLLSYVKSLFEVNLFYSNVNQLEIFNDELLKMNVFTFKKYSWAKTFIQSVALPYCLTPNHQGGSFFSKCNLRL